MIDFFEYADLIPKLNDWTKAYADGNPVVSDVVYDEEYKKLKEFELNNPDMIDKDSPTQKVQDSSGGFAKVDHTIPMLSIANSMNLDELRNWSEDKYSKTSLCGQTIEFKIDGLAMSLIYKDGQLSDAITRGNGTTGDRVYANALRIDDIPKTIDREGIVEVRGEVVWLKDDFNAYNKKLEALGKDLMSNPRNGASGTMKSKDPQDVADRVLSFVGYSIVQGSECSRHSDDLNQLIEWGFTVSEFYICPTVDKVIAGAEYMEKKRHTLPYLIDGLVIKVDDKTTYKRLGGTSKTPHFCTALKFPPEEKVTKLLEIEHSYGRSGAVTPVAIVEEVELALTKVRRASLHNWDMAEYLGVFKGCSVKIRKAGEIIPEIVEVVEIGRTKDEYEKALYNKVNLKVDTQSAKYEYQEKADTLIEWYERPLTCVHCNTTLTNERNRSGDELVAWVCPNSACSVKQFKNIVRFVSKDAMNMMGVGESLVESLLSKGLIKNSVDLYKLTLDDFLTLDGVKERSAKNALKSIEQSKNNYLDKLLVGLGISNLGRSSSTPIAEAMGTFDSFCNATVKELSIIEGVGDDLVGNIIDWISDDNNRQIIEDLKSLNIAQKAKPNLKQSDKLDGKVLIMTGKFDGVGRDEFKKLVVEHGGTVSSGISKKVTHVLLGDGAGPAKIKKIDELKNAGHNIEIIDDVTFLQMIS